MASFSNKPPILLHLLLLILSPPFIDQGHKLFAQGYTLIEQECFSSDTPETCKKCVKSDPGSGKADRVGIAVIVVHCIRRQAETLAANMTTLASHEIDKELKYNFLNCSSQYSNAKGLLGSAKRVLQNHDYDNAETFVVRALSFDSDCHDSITGYEDKIPGDVSDRMKNYEELSEAACRIIERLT